MVSLTCICTRMFTRIRIQGGGVVGLIGKMDYLVAFATPLKILERVKKFRE